MLNVDQSRRINIRTVQRHVWCTPAHEQSQLVDDSTDANGTNFLSQPPRQRLGAISFPTRESKDPNDERQYGLKVLHLAKKFGINVQNMIKVHISEDDVIGHEGQDRSFHLLRENEKKKTFNPRITG